ncbi:MAG TPA: PEP/pyruvate-binding domain-containing protein [Thermodesulfovibrionales bacterium]|nr:PEP/pyruvate-binding domain-containing protein [Thermodesulfovibrionales bacterium]
MKNLSVILKQAFGKRSRGSPVDMRTFLHNFKTALESNNRALEIITDMGEKLSGEYLFDINYIRKAYAELHANIRSSITTFNSLTRNRYEIGPACDRIDSMIIRVIYEEAPFQAGRVVFYEGITWEMAREVGGKNYHLSQLRKDLDLNVPGGFTITALTYDEFIRHNGIDKKIEELSSRPYGDKDLQDIRDAIIAGEFPEPAGSEIEKATDKLKDPGRSNEFLAVRSSAEEEDGDFSFAGQFETILNVPLESFAVKAAYKKVISSLFAPTAVSYQKRLGYAIGGMRMPVGCVLMVDAVASGVVYTSDPSGGRNRLTIIAAWGLGKSVVEGKVEPDVYSLEKGPALKLIGTRVGTKETMVINSSSGGTVEMKTPADLRAKTCMTEEQVLRLAGLAIDIERYFKRPQDIEWALGKDGKLYILQSRPLRITEADIRPKKDLSLSELSKKYPVLIKDKGYVVQKGIAVGRVFILKNAEEIDGLPKGVILVARNDSPQFVRAMPYVSAIITDTGAPASHMASICREFRIPTIVNTREATHLLQHGQEITLYADEEGSFAVYDGLLDEMIAFREEARQALEELYEFRRKKYIMRFISPLNLVNPLTDEFTPKKCKTMHDVLRFMHEKSVQELIEASMNIAGKGGLKKLELPIPAGIHVIDIGGGLHMESGEKATLDQVVSEPLRAVVQGMLHPGAWHSEAVALQARDFLTSMMRMEEITSEGIKYASRNVAVISGEYLNLTLRFGYHFNLLDCFCSEKAANNHIYFRFVGGATDISKRSRRIRLIAEILKEYGFNSSTKGDLIIARLSHIEKDEILNILDMAGRLIAFTRQLDAVLNDDSDIERYKKNFFKENFTLG